MRDGELDGMQYFDGELEKLLRADVITRASALLFATNVGNLQLQIADIPPDCGDPADTECTDADTCNGTGSCQANDAAAGNACGDPGDTECTNPDSCNGTGSCQTNDAAAGG